MQRLSKKIAEEFDWYLAISRGGLIPAVLLSHLTDVRQIDTLCAVSYSDDKTQGEINIIEKDYSHLTGKKVLIVDDLVDSGKTLDVIVDYIKDFKPALLKTAVIFKKASSIFTPDYFVEERPDDAWIDFPWEVDQSLNIK